MAWVMRCFSMVLVAAPLLGCYGETSDNDREGEQDSEQPQEPAEQEPVALVSDCTEENSAAECELRCHLASGVPVTGLCMLASGGLNCMCDGGPSDGRFFQLSSCDDLEASIASVCTEQSPTPFCPLVLPASGETCSHRQTCSIEEFRSDCAPGQTVRSRSLLFYCYEGVWQEGGVGEEFCQ